MLPSVYPSLMMDASNEMNMIERFQNFLMEMFMSTVGAHFKSKPIDAIFRKKYGDDFPSTQELVTKAKFLLANVNPDVEFPVPVTSKVTYFGGLGMSNESKPLQEPYASFVGSAKSIVFISFGSVADPKMMPVSWKKAFVELFKKNSDVHFIWRMENDVEVPKNVLRNTWHPQSDILAHPKTAAFITHAGYNSLGESIASGTPIITVPLFGDQFRNSRLAEFRGFGVRVDKTKLNVETLNAALHKIIDNPSYKRSAQSLRNIVFSSPFKAGDALRHAVNFAIEYPDHNRDLPALNFVQLYSLDVIVVLVSVVAFFVWINVFLIKRLLRCTCRVSISMRNWLLLSLVICCVSAAKVAVFLLPLSNSHVIFTIRVAEELAQDHDVVIIRPHANPEAAKIVSKHPRVREIRPNGAKPEAFWAFKNADKKLVWTEPSIKDWRAMGTAYTNVTAEICYATINDEAAMAQLREEKFDFAIAHHLEFCPVSVIHALGIPAYGFMLSTPLSRQMMSFIGVPLLPSIYPNNLIDASNEMTFAQRFKNVLFEIMMATLSLYSQTVPVDRMMKEKYGAEFPRVLDLTGNAKFLLANVHPDIEFPVPVTSKVTYFGGLGMSNVSKPLEEPYASFVQSAKTVVFVSFGSVAEPKTMPAMWRNAFVELFEKNPDIHFIWRMENDVQVPKNVLRRMWHPQNDILAHPKTAAFITHAGYNSIGESIASGTPLITVPLFADQFRNSRLAEYRGFGVRVEKTSFNFETLHSALHQILDDPSYDKAAKSLRKIVFSSPVKAGDALRHAVNFAIEFPDHNRDLPSLNFVQLYSLDMIGLLLSIVVLSLLVTIFVLKRVFRFVRSFCVAKEKTAQADSVGHSLLAMYRLTLFALALCLSCAESRVSFTTAEVLDNVDFKGNDEVNLNCFNGCRVFSPTKNDDIFIIDSNRTRIISLLEISELDNGVNLNVGEFYTLVNRGPANPSFILYAAQRQSPNFMTKVVYLDATKSLKVNPKDTFGVLTVLSSSGAVNVNGLSGDYEVYATGFDAINDCCPVYQSRSITNAEKTFVKVNGPIATMRLKGYLAGAMLTLSGDPTLSSPVTVDSSAVFVSKGYVGCKNPGGYSLVPATNAPEDSSFTLADNGGLSASLDSDYSFVKSGTSEVDITVNGEDVRLTGTDQLRKTFDPAASVKVDFAWKNRRTDDVFAIQIDVLKKSGDGETKLTTLSTPETVQTTTTKVSAHLSVISACILVLICI
ncbi:hypothetical protein PRIPAC_89428 [Pristionchus pacificus]|uniref:glucuronosyltransferase n=1 Tax=Pristionchus pacificus TaxID=54126 RepID=A0A2A6B7P9_PRIPA|nr:hypothetical protein PRIPAC_89428 [Pristionchus pacificus]|eukprot:PDM61887.1 Glycosyltransferase [Pristionchus pacificus]